MRAFPLHPKAALIAALLLSSGLSSCRQNKASSLDVFTETEQAEQRAQQLIDTYWISDEATRQEMGDDLARLRDEVEDRELEAEIITLLALNALERGEVDDAEELLRQCGPAPGSIVDGERLVLFAEIARLRGDADQAVELLLPLQGKIVNREISERSKRGLVLAALDKKDSALTLRALRDWLTSGPAVNPRAEAELDSLITEIPTESLLTLLNETDGSARHSHPAEQSLKKHALSELTDRALSNRDAQLAETLLAEAPIWLRAEERGDQLVMLAAAAVSEVKVAGRTLGIVIGGSDVLSTSLSVRAAVGVLSVFRKEKKAGILLQERRNDLLVALRVLRGQGAGLLVAGTSPEDAKVALDFANEAEIPILVLSAPPKGTPLGRFGFLLGMSEEEELAAVKKQSGIDSLQSINDVDYCSDLFIEYEAGSQVQKNEEADRLAEVAEAARNSSSPAALLAANAEGVALLMSRFCARRWLRAAVRAKWDKPTFLGLSTQAPYTELDAQYIKTEDFPRSVERAPQFRYSASEEQPLERKLSFAEALGRDAAALSLEALLALPEQSATDEAAIRHFHVKARDALVHASTELITARSSGFDSSHKITRKLSLVSKERFSE